MSVTLGKQTETAWDAGWCPINTPAHPGLCHSLTLAPLALVQLHTMEKHRMPRRMYSYVDKAGLKLIWHINEVKDAITSIHRCSISAVWSSDWYAITAPYHLPGHPCQVTVPCTYSRALIL